VPTARSFALLCAPLFPTNQEWASLASAGAGLGGSLARAKSASSGDLQVT